MKTSTEFSLNPEEKRFLLEIARESIRDHLTGKAVRQYTRSDLSPALSEHAGAFVSLHKGKKLRGCIGRFGSEDPLFQLVQKMAVSSACNDYRFKPNSG